MVLAYSKPQCSARVTPVPRGSPLSYDRHLLSTKPLLPTSPLLGWGVRVGRRAANTRKTPAPENTCSSEQCPTDEEVASQKAAGTGGG